MTEDGKVGWHHRIDRQEFEQTLGVGDAAVHSLSLVPFLPPFLIPFYNSMIFYFLKAIWFFPASLPTKEHLGVSCSLLLSPIIIVSPSVSLCSL